MTCKCEHWQVCDECRPVRFPKTEDKDMTKELLQQALDALEPFAKDAASIDPGWSNDRRRNSLTQDKPLAVGHFREAQKVRAAIEQALAQQEKSSVLYQDNLAINYAKLAQHCEMLEAKLAQQEQPASVDAYVGAREDAAIWKKRALEAEELNRKFIAEVNGPTYLGEPAQQEQPAQEQVTVLPDGSAFSIMSSPLPADHWLYREREYATPESEETVDLPPPFVNRTTENRELIRLAARWAIRAATDCGKENDFDPDALVQNFVYATLGPYPQKIKDTAPTQPAQEASATWTEMVVANLVREGVNKHRARELAAHFLTLPTQQALSDDEILNCFYASKSEGMVSYMLAVGRAIEAHCRGGADK